MDSEQVNFFVTAIDWIVGIVCLIGFLHIWSLTSQIRKEARRQTQLLVLGFRPGTVVGRIGVAAVEMSERHPRGSIKLDDEEWSCRISSGLVISGDKVRVVNADDVVLLVERVTTT